MGEKFARNLTEVTEVLARIIDLSWQTRDAEVHHNIDDLILVHVSITDITELKMLHWVISYSIAQIKYLIA